jgi:hypothetical protein
MLTAAQSTDSQKMVWQEASRSSSPGRLHRGPKIEPMKKTPGR